MKTVTINQLRFALLLALLTTAFRFGLSSLLDSREFAWVWVAATAYAVAIFCTGWILGKKDNASLPLFDIGLRFHATTYIVFNGISELWFLLGFQSGYESIVAVHLTALIWGFLLVVHFILFLVMRKNSIKGLEKSEIFE